VADQGDREARGREGREAQGRGRGSDEDLFQDFDEYFAPLEEGDWSEEEQGPGRSAAEVGEASDAAPPGDAGREPEETEQMPEGTEPPIVEPADFDVDIPDPEELVADLPAEPEPPEPPPGAVTPPEEEGEPGPEVIEAAFDRAEAELGTEAPGEEGAVVGGARDSGDPEEGGEVTPGPVVGGRASTGEDLSVEDLRAAPPQYADLPGPEDEAARVDEEPAAVPPEGEDLGDVSLEDLERLEEEEPVLAEEATFESLEGLPAAPELETELEELEAPGAVEPPEEEAVEAAAEHFAEGVRSHPEDVERELLADLEAPSDESVTIDAAGVGTPLEEGGPTWEEGPATTIREEEEAAAAPPGVPPGRNLVAAFVTGVALAVAVIVLLAIGRGAFAVFASIVILLGQGEFYAVLHARGYQPATLLGLVAGAFTLAGAYLFGEIAIPFGVFLATALTVPWYMAAQPKAREGTVMNAGVTLLGVVYVPVLAAFALLPLRFEDSGTNVFLTVVGLTILYDICAYAIGSLWGNRPLAPTVSPQKSWEGAIGATLVLLLVALAIVPTIDPFTPAMAIGLALVIAVAAPLGDLVESAIKRDLGVKDMSTLLPGHGGILDRIDAILFAAPAAYYFLRLAF
jgi:phosphatidate cytidylyltransferase